MKKTAFFVVLLMLFSMLGNVLAFAAPEEGNAAELTLLEGEYDMEYYTRYKDQGLTLNVYNWGEYISNGDDGSLAVNAAFEELTGIDVVYSTFDTNESLYAKLKTGGKMFLKVLYYLITVRRRKA